jgi:hypothetical protein
MRKLTLIAAVCFVFALTTFAHAQQANLGLGFGTLLAPSASSADSSHYPQSIRGGLYTSIRADIFIKKHLGIAGQVAWRNSMNGYNTGLGFLVPFRPIIYDFNAIYGERFSKQVGADVLGGIGGQDTRFYSSQVTCGLTCTNYTSSSHFLTHLGGDVRIYVHGNIFVRPEVNWYYVFNNNEFSSNSFTRVGASIGYSFF